MIFPPKAGGNPRWFMPLLLVCVIAGCSRSTPQSNAAPDSASSAVATPIPSPTPPPQIISTRLMGLVATLEDETRDLSNGQIAWTTYWKLCWDAYPGAQGYEFETMTGEGAS